MISRGRVKIRASPTSYSRYRSPSNRLGTRCSTTNSTGTKKIMVKKTKSSDVFPEEQPKPVVQKWVLDEIERAKRMLIQNTARLSRGLRQVTS